MSTSMLRRQMKNIVHNFSEAEIKVREATSNDPWGPSSSLMSEISDLTYNVVAFSEIMSMVWKRLNDHGKNWRHVYKAMTLLDYLIKTGSDRVTQQCKENIYTLQILKDFQYIDRDGKDQGVNVREKAKQLVTLLKDEERLLEERTNALKTKEKMAQTTNTSSTPLASGLTSSLGTREEALDMSKKILEQIEKGASDPWRAPAVPSTALSSPPAIATTPVSASDPWGGNGTTTGSPTNSDPWGGEASTSTPPTSSDPWGGEGTVSVQSAKSDPWGVQGTTSAPPTSSDPWGGEETTSAPPTSSDPWGGEETTSAQPTSSDPWGGEETTSAPPTSSDPWGGEETTPVPPTSSDPWGGEKTTSVTPISSDPWGGEETTSALPTSSDPWGDASVATPWSSTRQSELCDFKVAETERGDSAEKSLDLSSLGTCLPVRKTPESFLGPNAALVDLGSLVPNTPKQTPLPTTLSQSKEG